MSKKRFKYHAPDRINDGLWIKDNYNQFHEIDLETDCGEQICNILNELEKEKEYWRDKALHKELI